eukprot:GHVT01049888.1.p1 GENE.GHVT01049888.1~~GHVT01049888.1.p1  ORF type:complete len:177 (-),score=28.60 GHVT01049888.1:1185-1715(-)
MLEIFVSLVGFSSLAVALLAWDLLCFCRGALTCLQVRRYGGAFVQGVHTYLRECGFGAILPSAPAAAPLASSDKPQHSQRSLQPHYENLTNDATGSSSSSSIEHLQGYSYQQASSFAGLRNMDNTHMQLQRKIEIGQLINSRQQTAAVQQEADLIYPHPLPTSPLNMLHLLLQPPV